MAPRKAPSEIRIVGDLAYIQDPVHPDVEFIIDAEDVPAARGWRWAATGAGYAQANIGGTNVLLHRLLCPGLVDGLVTDHINRNRQDNRKVNLRAVTERGNVHNTTRKGGNGSGYPNVYWLPKKRLWKVQVSERTGGMFKSYHLGSFKSLKAACERAHQALTQLGRFAPPVPQSAA